MINIGPQVLPTPIDDFMVPLSDYPVIHASIADDEVTTIMALFGQVPQHVRESEMYNPLVRGPLFICRHSLTPLCTRPLQFKGAFEAIRTLSRIAPHI